MDVDEFWALIDRSHQAEPDDIDAQQEELASLLRGRSREDLIEFRRLYDEQVVRAYRWDLWGAGYLINGGMSNDSFEYFREWLISRGRAVYERALEAPDSLADVVGEVDQGEGLDAEGFGYAANSAFADEHGEELPFPDVHHPADPAGEEWDEGGDELRQWFPRLWARFGRES